MKQYQTFARSPRVVLGWMACCSLLTLTACGGDRLARLPVSGTVTLDGQPLASGAVTLHPLGDGVSAGGPIEAGTFAIAEAKGPTAGSYRVEIVAYEDTGQFTDDPDLPGQKIETQEQILPPRYNRDSELTIEVQPDTANQFTFELHSS